MGKTQVDQNGMAHFDVGANGPPLLIHSFGTGFLAASARNIITNHHVVEPWWNDHDLSQLLDHGVAPDVLSYEAYFPGRSVGMQAKLDRISSKADVATLKLEGPAPAQVELLELDGRSEASVTGEPVVLIGFPTGVDGILARAESEVAPEIAGGTQNVSLIVSQLASQHLIRPITTQGHIGDVLKDKIVHDAATTFGGSGGPLFNRNGKVIGINTAMIEGFGGSNLAVPVKYANDLLK
jgi:S1-C subfamily serine protease